MEPFVQAARSVIEGLVGCSARPGAIGLAGSTFTSGTTNLAAIVSGELSGDVMYSMSGETAERLASAISGTQVRAFGRSMGHGLSQLGVLLAEQTRRTLDEHGYVCEVGRPIVFQAMNVEFSVAEPALSVPVETEIGQLNVSVAVRNGQ